MSGYSPVLFGETSGVRHEVESLLTPRADLVQERLDGLSDHLRALGWQAMFGTESELTTAANPHSAVRPIDDERFYVKTVERLMPDMASHRQVPKGAVFCPVSDQPASPVLVNERYRGRYNHEQDNVVEIRSGVDEAQEADDQYWDVIDSGAVTAAENGLMVSVEATHLSATISRVKSRGERIFTVLQSNPALVGSIQYCLNALYPLQLSAGVVEGFAIEEAFCGKGTTTSIHECRIERRHPTLGITDPRIDMLGILQGTINYLTNNVPERALWNSRRTSRLQVATPNSLNIASDSLARLINEEIAVWDQPLQRFVTRAHPIEATASYGATLPALYRASREVCDLSDDTTATIFAGDGQPLKDIFSQIRRDDAAGFYTVRRSSGRLKQAVSELRISSSHPGVRVLPHILYDSPEAHERRRAQIAHSSVVRSILGKQLTANLTPAKSAIEARRSLIENIMVES